ncbi:MAG: hypothetical protein WB797_07440, partial [Nocardioides sp.]
METLAVGRALGLREICEAVVAAGDPPTGDQVLPFTRGLPLFIIAFLVAAAVILCLFPGHTDRVWSSTIPVQVTSMVLASAHLGGESFFARHHVAFRLRGRPSGGWRQDDAEAGDRQPEQNLSRCEQVGDARGAEHLQLGQPGVVRRRAGEARGLQLRG